MRHYNGIDFLRGMAVLSVIVYHVYAILGVAGSKIFSYIHYFGLFGVSLFFIISGFLVYGSFSMILQKYTLVNAVKKYSINRLFRILPAYYFNFFIVILLASTAIGADYFYTWGFLKQIVANLTFTSYFIYKTAGLEFNGAYWTLNVEMLWYLLVPFIVLYFKRDKYIVWGIVVSFLLFAFLDLVYYKELFGIEKSQMILLFYFSFQFFPQFAFFGIGILIYKHKDRLDFSNRLWWLVSGMLMVVFMFLSHKGVDTFVVRNLLIFVVSTLLFVFLYRAKVFKYCVISWIGKISYSLYLWHFPILVLMKKQDILHMVSFSSFVMIYAIVLLVISSFSYYFIEEKGFELKHKLAKMIK